MKADDLKPVTPPAAPDVNHLFDDMVATLVEARDAVREKLETGDPGPDCRSLLQLGQAVRTFAHQTDSLLLLMMERNAPEPLLERVEDLFEYFHEVGDRIDRQLRARGPKISPRGPA